MGHGVFKGHRHVNATLSTLRDGVRLLKRTVHPPFILCPHVVLNIVQVLVFTLAICLSTILVRMYRTLLTLPAVLFPVIYASTPTHVLLYWR